MADNWTEEELADATARYQKNQQRPKALVAEVYAAPKPSKYHSKKTEVDGIIFDSKKEAEKYVDLKIAQSAGAISQLRLQPRFLLQESFVHSAKKYAAIEYVSDFSFFQDGKLHVLDVKSIITKTPIWRLKFKLAIKKYPDIIWETC